VTVCLLLVLPINQLTVLSALATVGGLYFFFVGFRMLSRKRVLLNTPTSKIRSATMGLVEVNGMATGPYTMLAPITGKPCFLYHTTAWQQREGKEKQWEKVVDETLHVPFFVDDSTGQLLIEPLGANLDLHRDFREEYDKSFFSSDLDSIPARVGAFLNQHGIVASRSLRIEERLIKPEDELFIAGTLTENPGVQLRPVTPRSYGAASSTPVNSSFAATAPQVVQLSSGPAPTSTHEMSQQAKIAAALTRAGITKPEAWSVAGVPYESAPYQSMAVEKGPLAAVTLSVQSGSGPVQRSGNGDSGSGSNPAPPVVLMKGANDSTFVISFRSQKEFLSSLAWKSAAMVWGGAAITLLGIYMLLLQMELF
jgi:hypothetical protein